MRIYFLALSIFISNLSCGQTSNSKGKQIANEAKQFDPSDLIPYRKGKLYGYANRKKEIIIPIKYTRAELFNQYGLAKVATGGPNQTDKKYGYINKKGEEVIPLGKYADIGQFEDSVTLIETLVKDTLLYGVIDIYGKEIVKPQYNNRLQFKNGFAVVTKFNYPRTGWNIQDKTGLINRNGEVVIPVEYAGVSQIVKGVAVVQQFGLLKFALVSQNGEMITPFKFDGMNAPISNLEFNEENTSSGLIPAMVGDYKTGKWGFINFKGETVIPFQYQAAFYFKNGYSIVKLNNKWGAINIKGEITISVEYDAPDNYFSSLFLFGKAGKYGFINAKNETVIPFKYDYAHGFNNGLAIVSINKTGPGRGRFSGFVDSTGKEVIQLVYDGLEEFHDGLARANKNGKYGFIDIKGKEVIPFIYKESDRNFTDGYVTVQNEIGMWGVIDKSNKTIIPFKYEQISPVPGLSGVFVILNMKGYEIVASCVDSEGNEYFED